MPNNEPFKHPMDQPLTLEDLKANIALKKDNFYNLIKIYAEASPLGRTHVGIRDDAAFVRAVENAVRDTKQQLEKLISRYEKDNPDN